MSKQTAINKIIELEKKHKLLSGDMLHQDDLFKVQEELCSLLVLLATSEADKKKLTTEIPYLFEMV